MRDGAFTCGNCEFAEGRHATAEQVARAEEAGHPVAPLHCLRYPAPVAKRPDQWCGEHSAAVVHRDEQLGLIIVQAIRARPEKSR